MKVKIFMCLAVAAVMVGCTDPDKDPKKLVGCEWKLQRVEINDENVNIPAEAPKLTFTDSLTINGNGGCNLFFGVYKAEKSGKITVEPQGMTRALCPDAQFEERYVKALGQVNEFEFEDEYLELENDPLEIKLIYRRSAK